MTWTYSGDPSSTTRDEVRFLVGDTNTNDQLVTDEEIAYALASESTYNAAATVAEAIAAKLSREADFSVDGLSKSLSDKEAKNHRYYAQLGYALKDKMPPDWEEAEKLLTKAIEIRGDGRREGWLYYEFNRAICRIELDNDYLNNKRSTTPEVVKKIVADLYAVANSDLADKMEEDDGAIQKWMALNDYPVERLKANQ